MTARAVVAVGLLAAFGAAPSPAGAADAGPDVRASLSPQARAAFDLLMAAKRFEGAAVGEGGKPSEGARAVRTLIKEREAPAAFQAIYDRGTVPGALYALAAFWYLRPGDYPELLQSVRARHGGQEVETLFGCIGGKHSVGELLERKDRDVVRLRPGTAVYGLMCPPGKRRSFTEDFAGGAIPIQIVEGGIIEDRRCAHPPPLPDYLKPRR
jgi:hypothetical protein